MTYSEARIHKLLNHLVIIAENFSDLDFNEARKDDIKGVIAWIQEQDYSPETKKITKWP